MILRLFKCRLPIPYLYTAQCDFNVCLPPPPPSRELFAAFTIASLSRVVISPTNTETFSDKSKS